MPTPAPLSARPHRRRWPCWLALALTSWFWLEPCTAADGEQPAPAAEIPAATPAATATPAPPTAGQQSGDVEEPEQPPAAALAGDIVRLRTLATLGKIGWQDARFRTRSVLEVGEYTVPAPRNPANRIFLLQDKNPQWAGGWMLIKRGPGGAGFALYDETGKAETPVVLAQCSAPAEMLQAATAGTATWELVRLAWPVQNRKRFFLYSEPTQAVEAPKVGMVPNDFPPLLLRTFPVRPSNFDGLDDNPVSVDVLRNRLFNPRDVNRGPIGKRFMIDDRENPFGNLNSHDYYASTYDGFLLAPVAGRYRFFMEADTYGLLLIDAQFLLDTDGMAAAHGSGWRGLQAGLKPAQLKRASRTTASTLELHWRRPLEIDLSAGLHRVTLLHAEVTGDQGVRLAWQLPDEPQPHLIAPDCFQSILPAATLGWQVASGEADKPAPGGFEDSLQVDLVERVLINGDSHNRVARLRTQWLPAPTTMAAASKTAEPGTVTDSAPPRWWQWEGSRSVDGLQGSAAATFCVPIAQPSGFWCQFSHGSKVLALLTIPDDLSDQGYLRENVRLTAPAETTFAYPGEDWTLHLSADRVYGDLIQPRLHICFEESPLTLTAAPAPAAPLPSRATLRAMPEANLRINGLAAQTPVDPRVYSLDLPWNGPTRTPVRIDLDPAALSAIGNAGTSTNGQPSAAPQRQRTVTMTVWIEAAGVPLDCASWTFSSMPAAGKAPGTLQARRDHLEWADLSAPAVPPVTGLAPLLLPPFAALPPRNPHAVLVLDREDPALHRRSLITGTVAALATRRQPEAVLFVGDPLSSRLDLKSLARLGAVEMPRLNAAPADGATDGAAPGPQAAAAALARESRSGQWLNLPLSTLFQAHLHGWAQGVSDRSDLFAEAMETGDSAGSVTFALAAGLQAVPSLKGGNGLAVISLGPRDCTSSLPLEQTVRGLDAAFDQLRARGYPRIVVLGPTPVAGDGNFATAAAGDLSRALGVLCREHGARYIDAIEELRAADADLQALFRSADGDRVLQAYPQAAGLKRLQDAVLQIP